MRSRIHLALFSSLTLLAAVAAPAARGQCFGPDSLDLGPCCGPAQLTLPPLTQGISGGLGICWNNCAPGVQNDLQVTWTTPLASSCSSFTAILQVADMPSGMPLLGGLMHLDYTRTWYEIDDAGNDLQVWRFAVKVDLASALPAGATPPCPIPDCLPPLGTTSSAFFYGYLDYAMACGAPGVVYRHALVLFHGCDFLQHKPGLSSRPGVFHPNRSYAIVAPHNTVQTFVPANLPHAGGGLAWEGLRKNLTIGGAVTCGVEDRLDSGAIQPIAGGCLCPLSAVPPQNTISFVSGKGTCLNSTGQSSQFQSLNIAFPILPWPYMVSTSIGRWSSSAVYPGQEVAWVNEGLFRTYDVCDNTDYFEVKYGSTTEKGWAAFVFPGGPPADRLFDLVDNWTAPVAGPHPLPLLGNVMPTDHLIYTTIQ